MSRPQGPDLLARLARELEQSPLASAQAPLLVAVSGGADSIALLHLCHRLGVPLRAAHLDHGLREGSEADRRFVEGVCADLGVPLSWRRVEVAPHARAHGLSPEHAGRRLRYRFFRELLREHSLAGIATAHTQDDQAETVLLRLIRGTGTRGLAGILPHRRDRVVRPLLSSRRAELRAWLREQGLPWREDPTNHLPNAPRTWIRGILLPLMERWNPALVDRLAGLARAARQDEALLRALTRRAAREDPGYTPHRLLALPGPLRRRRLLALAHGLGAAHLQALEDLLQGAPGREIHLPGGARVRRTLTGLARVDPTGEAPPPPPVSLPLTGRLQLPGWGLLWEARLGPAATPEELTDPDPRSLALDAGRLVGPLLLRGRLPGDRLRPAGRGGSLKLKKYLLERRIEPDERDKVPLLASGDQIVWVVGHAPDERFLPGPGTREILSVRLTPIHPAPATPCPGEGLPP